MKKILLLLLFLTSCASDNYYKYKEYVYSCVDKENYLECHTLDEDLEKINFHKLEPWQSRQTKPMP